MDLYNQGLTVHYNLAIRTNDLTVLARSKEVSSEVFEESKNCHHHQNS